MLNFTLRRFATLGFRFSPNNSDANFTQDTKWAQSRNYQYSSPSSAVLQINYGVNFSRTGRVHRIDGTRVSKSEWNRAFNHGFTLYR